MLSSRRIALIVVALPFLFGSRPPARGSETLAARIKKITEAPEYRHSHWGLLVVDATTGRTVYEQDADHLFAPASVTKLYTCAAALAALGPDFKFTTPVYRRGEVNDGRLAGDLILVAVGDPTLGGRTDADGHMVFKNHDHTYSNWADPLAELTDTDPLAGLAALARQVKEAGIRRVDGEVLIDERLFARARGSGSGPSLLSPIVVNDNVVDVEITPAKHAGDPATVRLRPRTPYVRVDVQVETVAKGKPLRIEAAHVGLERFVFRGQIPAGHRPVLRICPVDNPATFARALFIESLRREGVKVRASALIVSTSAALPEKATYERLPRVAAFTSPPLSELLKVTLKVSHNLYAGTLPLLLAVKAGKTDLVSGMRQEGKVLAALGVDVKSISLETGAGGGNGDRVTPRATVRLLRAMARRPDFPVFKAALPVLGVDGTLALSPLASSPARGKVHAKTGTYGDADLLNGRVLLRSKALAGVMTTAKGRDLVIAFFVNEVPLPADVGVEREGLALARLCEVLYKHAE